MNSFVIGNDLIIKWKLVPPDGAANALNLVFPNYKFEE